MNTPNEQREKLIEELESKYTHEYEDEDGSKFITDWKGVADFILAERKRILLEEFIIIRDIPGKNLYIHDRIKELLGLTKRGNMKEKEFDLTYGAKYTSGPWHPPEFVPSPPIESGKVPSVEEIENIIMDSKLRDVCVLEAYAIDVRILAQSIVTYLEGGKK
jgi:hypothetical protein